MLIRALKDEDFVNYKLPSMFIGCAFCDFKCCKESNVDESICQNSSLARSSTLDITAEELYLRYIHNDISKSIVFGGLEPILQFNDICQVIAFFRNSGCNDDFVIYTGYYPNEIKQEILELKSYKNIIVKFGRYIPNKNSVHDDILGVVLASNNQFAERIA